MDSPTTSRAAGSTPQLVEEDRVLPGGWYTLISILIVTLFAFVDRQLLTLAAAPLAKSLNLSDSQIGMVQGLAFAVFTVIAVYPLAWAADRFDRRYVLGVCVLLWSLGTAAVGFTQNFTQLFIAAVAIAAGEAGLVPTTMAIVPDLFHGRKRVLANGINYFAAYVGIALALALGGAALGALNAVHQNLPPALRQFESWRLAFFALALPAPLMLLLIAFARLRHPRRDVDISSAKPAGPSLLEHLKMNRGAVGWIFAALGVYLLAFGGFFVWLPVVATRLFGATEAQNGAYMGLATAIGMFGGVFISTAWVRKLLVRVGQRASIRVAWIIQGIATPAILIFPFVTSAVQLYVVFGLLMLSGTAVGVLVPTMLQSMAPGVIRARFLAIYAIVSSLLSGIAPTLVGWLSDAIGGHRGLLYALVGVALPTWIVATIMFRLGERPFAALAEETLRIDDVAAVN